MTRKPKVVVVMPAYNAAKTLRITYDAIPKTDVDQVILVDDGSSDETLKVAKELKLEVFVHTRNFGYGGNQDPSRVRHQPRYGADPSKDGIPGEGSRRAKRKIGPAKS